MTRARPAGQGERAVTWSWLHERSTVTFTQESEQLGWLHRDSTGEIQTPKSLFCLSSVTYRIHFSWIQLAVKWQQNLSHQYKLLLGRDHGRAKQLRVALKRQMEDIQGTNQYSIKVYLQIPPFIIFIMFFHYYQ